MLNNHHKQVAEHNCAHADGEGVIVYAALGIMVMDVTVVFCVLQQGAMYHAMAATELAVNVGGVAEVGAGEGIVTAEQLTAKGAAMKMGAFGFGRRYLDEAVQLHHSMGGDVDKC